MAKPTVLLVEQDAARRVVLRRGLAVRGFLVLEAASCAAAWRLVQTSLVEAIVLARSTPVTDCIALARGIRRSPAAGVPLVALADERRDQFAFRVGTHHAAPHDIKPDDLASMLAQLLAATRTEPRPETAGRRRHPRYAVQLRAQYQAFGRAGEGSTGECLLLDVSAGGCRGGVPGGTPPGRGSRLVVTFQLPRLGQAGRAAVKLGGQIVWSIPAKAGRPATFGASWIGAPADAFCELLSALDDREQRRQHTVLPPIEPTGPVAIEPVSADDAPLRAIEQLLLDVPEARRRSERIEGALRALGERHDPEIEALRRCLERAFARLSSSTSPTVSRP